MWLALIVSVVVQGDQFTYPECSLASDEEVAALTRDDALSAADSLYVAASGDAIAVLARSKRLRGLTSLHVCTDDAGVRALARSKHLGGLEELTITASGEPLAADTVKRLVRARGLRKKLRSLRFVAGDSEAEKTLDDAGFLAIAEHLDLPALRVLDLSWHYWIPDDTIAAVQTAPWGSQLDTLLLCHTRVQADPALDAPCDR
jgi:hypothetical protein